MTTPPQNEEGNENQIVNAVERRVRDEFDKSVEKIASHARIGCIFSALTIAGAIIATSPLTKLSRFAGGLAASLAGLCAISSFWSANRENDNRSHKVSMLQVLQQTDSNQFAAFSRSLKFNESDSDRTYRWSQKLATELNQDLKTKTL